MSLHHVHCYFTSIIINMTCISNFTDTVNMMELNTCTYTYHMYQEKVHNILNPTASFPTVEGVVEHLKVQASLIGVPIHVVAVPLMQSYLRDHDAESNSVTEHIMLSKQQRVR